MAKRRKEQTIQWPKEEKSKQYNDQTKIDNITKTDLPHKSTREQAT
jgi:hypothetical protein